MRIMLAAVLTAATIACAPGEAIDDCYWRLNKADQGLFDLWNYGGLKEGDSPILEDRLQEAWGRLNCERELPPSGGFHFVKEPEPDCR